MKSSYKETFGKKKINYNKIFRIILTILIVIATVVIITWGGIK